MPDATLSRLIVPTNVRTVGRIRRLRRIRQLVHDADATLARLIRPTLVPDL